MSVLILDGRSGTAFRGTHHRSYSCRGNMLDTFLQARQSIKVNLPLGGTLVGAVAGLLMVC